MCWKCWACKYKYQDWRHEQDCSFGCRNTKRILPFAWCWIDFSCLIANFENTIKLEYYWVPKRRHYDYVPARSRLKIIRFVELMIHTLYPTTGQFSVAWDFGFFDSLQTFHAGHSSLNLQQSSLAMISLKAVQLSIFLHNDIVILFIDTSNNAKYKLPHWLIRTPY